MCRDGSGWINGERISGVSSPTYKWDILGLQPTDPNHLLTSWDIQVSLVVWENLGKLGTNMGHD